MSMIQTNNDPHFRGNLSNPCINPYVKRQENTAHHPTHPCACCRHCHDVYMREVNFGKVHNLLITSVFTIYYKYSTSITDHQQQQLC